MSWVATAVVSGVSLIGSTMAAKSQSKAINSAAASERAAADQQIALQREQLARAEQLNAPYITQGNKAQGYLDALTYGSGSYGAAPPPSVSTPAQSAQLEQILRQQNPDMVAYWDRWEAGGAKPGGHRDTFGDFAGYVQAERPDALVRAQESIQPTQTPVANAAAPNGQTSVSRAEVENLIAESLPYRYGEDEFGAQQGIADQTYAGESGLINDAYGAETADADRGYTLSKDVAGQAKTGRLGVAQSNLDQRLTNNENTYAAWDAIARNEADKAIDLNFSRGGVTGLVGQTRAGVAEVGQDYALDAYGRRTQLDADAYNPYYADTTNAENTYWGDVTGATDIYNNYYADSTATRGSRNLDAYGRRQNAYSVNQANKTANRQNAYADYVNTLTGSSDRGYAASGAAAGYGQSYTTGASNAIGRSADAASDAAYARGEVTQQLYGDVARVAGDAYGAITNRNDPKKTRGYM